MNLNQRAVRLVEQLLDDDTYYKIIPYTDPACGTRLVDCAAGGNELGLRLAEVCLAGLGQVRLVPARGELGGGPAVLVTTDHPLAACMASQYAGWKIAEESYFAMGSGPFRAAAGKEELFESLAYRESATEAVGVLETGKRPPVEVCLKLALETGVSAERLTLLFAPTSSMAGNVQVVARSVETALHKMHELGFDLRNIASGFGTAPLPPVAKDDLGGIGRTNDAILYGGEVTLYVNGEDAAIEAIGPQIPSSASKDHGEPFGKIFERYGGDFYEIDPHLFSPAKITLCNVDSGRTFEYGQLEPDILRQSFTS